MTDLRLLPARSGSTSTSHLAIAPLLALLAWISALGCSNRGPAEHDQVQQHVDRTLNERTAASFGVPPQQFASYQDERGVATSYFVDQVLFEPANEQELTEFLNRYDGTVLDDDRVPEPPPELGIEWDPTSPDVLPSRYVVRVDLQRVSGDYFDARGQVPGLAGYEFSSREAALLIALVTYERERGHFVEPNYLLEFDGLLHETSESGNFDMFDSDEFWSPNSGNGMTTAAAWQLMFAHGAPAPVQVAIIDSGFWLDNTGTPMLGTDLGVGTPTQWDFLDDDPFAGGAASGMFTWHGNKVASVALGLLDNQFGRAGSGGPVAVPMLFKSGPALGDVEDALRTARKWGADVVNMSFGFACNGNCSVTVDGLINRINQANDAGIILVASAGNTMQDVNVDGRAPCSLNFVTCVGALAAGSTNSANYSNYGVSVDTWAPGLLTAMPDGNSNGQLVPFGGTSAAAPYVAGIAAMMRSVDPGLNSDAARNMLLWTGKMSSDPKVTSIVDARAAVAEAMGYSVPPDALEGSIPNLQAGAWETELTVDAAPDSDTFRIVSNGYHSLTVSAEHMRRGLGSLSMNLVREEGTPCQAPVNFHATQSDETHSTYAADLLAPGSYLLQVQSGAYPQRFHIQHDLQFYLLGQDSFEANDTFWDRKPLKADASATLHSGDVDWYATSSQLLPLLGAYHYFQVLCADHVVTAKAYEVVNGLPSLLGSETGDAFTLDLPLKPGDYAVRVSGPVSRYQYRYRKGLSDDWLDKFNEFHYFLEPLVPVTDVLVTPHMFFAAYARDAAELGVVLRGEGLALELLDADLRVVARGVTDEELGALVARPVGEFDENAGVLVHVAGLSENVGESPFEIGVGADL